VERCVSIEIIPRIRRFEAATGATASVSHRAYVVVVELISVDAGRIAEAAATLARAMLDEPLGRWLLPDPVEFLAVHERLFVSTMMRALDEGRVDACGDPFVGVAVWFERPAIGKDSPRSQPTSDLSTFVPKHAAARVDEVARLLQLMRRQARPDRHVYLDSIGVLPDHRRRGYAMGLLGSGFGWANALALPCSLDTLDPDNVAFYLRRGFEVVATQPVAGSGLTITSMRRPSA
jgi:GNAT superfamily N-acetyltransferase